MIASSLVFVGLVVLCATVEAVWPARRPRWWHRKARTDVAYWLVTPVVSHALVVAVLAAIVCAIAAIDGMSPWAFLQRTTWVTELPRGVQLAMLLVIGDALGYVAHRLLHARRLWRFHAIHHSCVDLDWLASSRLHPIDDLVQRAIQLAPLVVAGFDPAILGVDLAVLGALALVLHANVRWSFGPLRYVIASPAFHCWHHTSGALGRDTNFAGLFPIWDLAFGTYHLPRGELPDALGVTDPIPDGLVAQLAWPFSRRPR